MRLDRAPLRIVAMLPSAVEMICAVGACDALVATGDFAAWPPAVRALPKVGGLYNPSIERIVAVRPDLVVLSPFDRAADALARLGVTTYVLRTETFDEIFLGLEALGKLLAREAQAAAAQAGLRAALDRLTACAAAQPARPSVYYEIDAVLYAAGESSYIGGLIARAGARNMVSAELGRFPRLSAELVLLRDPDVVILADAPFGVTAKEVASRPGWGNLRAVREGRVCELAPHELDVLQVPGPRVARGLLALIRCIHPRAPCAVEAADACEDGAC